MSTNGTDSRNQFRAYQPTWRDKLIYLLLGKNSLGRPDGDGYTVRVAECHRFLDWHVIPDPFITTTIRPSGWRPALAMLLGLYEIQVVVSADPQTMNRVIALEALDK